MQRILYAFLLFCPAFLFGQNTYTAPEFGELIVTGCSGIIYDSGGPDANYTDDNQSLIYIQGEGDYLELTFTEFDIENIFDELYLLEGNGAEGQVIGVYSGNTLPNDGNPIQIPSNEVTIVFISDFIINGPGFALEFACAESDNPPVANAGFPSLTCNGTVAFSDASTSFPDTWEWDFGDGNTSTEQDPIHTYASDGVYTVTLTACNENGCDTFTGEIVFDSEDFACSNGVNIPANGTEETTVCNGILFDPGGPDGDYPEGAHGQFIISPPGATSVSVTFTEFNLGTSTGSWFSDAVYIYNTETSENLGYYTSTDLPNNGQPLVFNTSSITVVFSSDHYDNFSGFAMLWQANGTTEPPVAAFSTESLTVPLNAPVQFTDESENSPGLWEWTFGDGGTSDAQNPIYVFTEPGTYEINLTVGNCNGSDTAETITITVQEAPAITHDPESYNITLNAGDIGTEVLTICNEGAGDLLVDLAAQGANTGVGFQFGFNTNENGENFYWQLLDQDFNVVQEDFGPFAANSTYTAVMTGLNPEENYYILLGSSDESQTLETLLWYDAVGGEVFFEGFVTTGSDAIYWLGAPWVGEISAPWLASETEPGTVTPGACEEYTITFDASELNGGVYEGEIIINSNDSNNSTITIPVTLTVIGTPELVLSAENLDFGEVQVGGSASLDLTISNPGSDVLEVSGISLGNSVFSVSGAESVSLNPDAETTVTVSFSPEAITSYDETMTLVNNTGDDVEISVTGIGIAAPSLTLNPTEFTLEMISGQDTTLNVTAGNVGEAVLNYAATSASDGTGFLFNFTTDNWSGEFSWILTDSQGNEVLTSEGEFYEAFTTYDVLLSGLSTDETYTLLMFDIFGDGSLTDFTVTDLGSGAVVAQGSFPFGVLEYSETLGSPAESFVSVTPESGSLAINAEQILDIYIDTEGLSTGTYNIVVTLATNDPLQPTADVNITLYVIAPVMTDFAATPEFVCGNLPVQFSDETANVATSWSWDFGDGTTSELQNPTHTYAADGSYTVTLTACNSLGCETLTKEDYITVELACYAQNIPPEHQTETITVCSGNVYDSGGPNGDYLEGNFGTLIIAPPGAQQVTITFTEFNYEEHADFLYVYDGQGANAVLLGAYTGNDLEGVTLTAESGVLTLTEYTGHFNQLSGFVGTFNCNADPVQPVANFTYLGDSVCVNEPFLFFDQSTGNPDSWFWDFGNGFTSNEQNPVINFTATDTVNVSLTACNEIGCDTYIFEDVIIILDKECFQDEIPEGGFEGETTVINSCAGFLYDSGGEEGDYNANNLGAVTILRPEGVIGLSFTEFDYSDGDFVYIIDGDSFDDPIIGAYTGTELPEDGAPITSTGSVITIVEYTFSGIPASGFALTYTCTTEGENIGNLRVYNDEICDGILRFGTPEDIEVDTWQWNFGDGTTSTEAAPVHEYEEHGAYEVELVTCFQGVCQTQTTTIYSNKLVPEIEAPFAAALGEEVHFHGLTEQATHWNWDFGNGETSDHNAPSTVYTELGVHEVHIHLVNMNVHSTCDANHLHTVTVTEDGTTSSTEVETKPVKIFPNPTSNFVRVDAGGSTIDNLRLRSIDGREIRRAAGVDRMDVGDLSSGTYFLEVQTDGQLPKQFKVVVQR